MAVTSEYLEFLGTWVLGTPSGITILSDPTSDT
jgi:hypothetical protein